MTYTIHPNSERDRMNEDVLLDQTGFTLDAKGFAIFEAMVDKPPAPTDGLRRTLEVSAPWGSAASGDKTASQPTNVVGELLARGSPREPEKQ
jgi:hypothetical protein